MQSIRHTKANRNTSKAHVEAVEALGLNVYESAKKRIALIFEEFDNVCVSFSGGKDSGIMLYLCIDHIIENKLDRKISLFHVDYEAQYQMTTDHVQEVYSKHKDIIDPYWVCLPISAQCATSMYQSEWTPWDKDKKDLWVRELPEMSINEDNNDFGFFYKGMWDYELQEKFGEWLHIKNEATRTACLVGIRTQESLNRWRAIHSDNNINKYDGHKWSRKIVDDVYNLYPVYDWLTEDVWVYFGKTEYAYNKLYDVFYQAGLTPHQMRVASPFNDCAGSTLKLYKVIDPKNWGRMIGRVNGVNFTGIYGGTTAMGWRSITKPPRHTWKSYMEFLLTTLPEHTKKNYLDKLTRSIKSWKKGGAMNADTIQQLESEKAPLIRTGEMSNRGAKDKEVIRFDDYLDDTTIDNFKRIPTYKRMCICIMKNDHTCKYMGFAQNKVETELRSNAQNKYTNAGN